MNRCLILAAVLLSMPTLLAAADGIRYNQVHLQAEQVESVSNDTMHVSLGTYAEHRDPAALARRINQDMEWALAKARRVKGVKASTGSYQTWPITNNKTTTGWRGQQTLELEGRDTERLAGLAGELQERVQIKSMNFSVSDDKRTEVENRLIAQALEAFKERARIVVDNLKANSYRFVNINIGTSGHSPPVMYKARGAMAMEAGGAVAVEGGESDVRVNVNGTIELLIP